MQTQPIHRAELRTQPSLSAYYYRVELSQPELLIFRFAQERGGPLLDLSLFLTSNPQHPRWQARLVSRQTEAVYGRMTIQHDKLFGDDRLFDFDPPFIYATSDGQKRHLHCRLDDRAAPIVLEQLEAHRKKMAR